jgi:terminase small subunit-like protein
MLADAIDPDRVLREAGRLAYSDIRELFDDKGNFLPIKQWPDDIARAVSSVEVVKKNVTTGDGKVDDVLKVRLWDKPSKLTNLMKHHGQLVDRVEVSGDAELLARLDAGRKRLAERMKAK